LLQQEGGKGQQQRVMSLFNSAIAVVVACCKSVHFFLRVARCDCSRNIQEQQLATCNCGSVM